MSRRSANPLHGYLASDPARTLCRTATRRKRHVLVSLESLGGLDVDQNPCDECLYLARTRQDEFRAALAGLQRSEGRSPQEQS